MMNGPVNVPGVSYPEFKNHGNHVPAAETADNAKFLRNDNTWQKVTPESIGAVTKTRVTEMINTALGVIENGTY